MNISGKEYGYIVSHLQYGLINYNLNQNDSLTLTGLDFRRVEIVLEHIDVYNNNEGGCADYLLISTADKICESNPLEFYINFKPLVSEITFIFKTTSEQSGKGFWLSYRGIFLFLTSSYNKHSQYYFDPSLKGLKILVFAVYSYVLL